ncbi:MAG TPA: MBL fold metallo-hydrolase [Terriglobales bacterium]|nr:MBL fold metallo-hydrolase [Terriglobales bacterium]
MHLRLIRHATLVVEYANHTLLVDPMLDDAAARPPIQDSPNPRNNPLVPLPMPAQQVVQNVDAVLVTHTHTDHWDALAAKLLPKNVPLFGQPEDETKFRSQGFTGVTSTLDSATWNDIHITRTPGQHGAGAVGRAMAPVSGFVLRATGEPALYIAGDTIWCSEVEEALRKFRPKITILNAGAAQFLQGGPITMTADDVITVCHKAPDTQVVAVHMESINHCLLTRSDLGFQLEAARVAQQVTIPGDGEWVNGPN